MITIKCLFLSIIIINESKVIKLLLSKKLYTFKTNLLRKK